MAGTVLIATATILNPERLEAILNRVEKLIRVIAQELGGFILSALPRPVRVPTQHLGNLIMFFGAQISYIINTILIPGVHLFRKFSIVICSIFLLLKGISFMVKLATS